MTNDISSIGFCGSRSLPESARPLVSSVVNAICSDPPPNLQLAVGFSTGADALVISSIPHHMLSRLTIFAAFGQGGKGSCSYSAVSLVNAAALAGTEVKWWAGGLPSVSLKQRLALRSVALAGHLARNASSSGGSAQHPPSALICFLSSPNSPGSLITCRRAAQLGVSIYAFCVGFCPTRLPLLNNYGHWIAVKFGDHIAFNWIQLKL
jgi:hypothetical protein